MTLAELEALQALFHRAVVHPTGIDAFLEQADADTRAAFDAAFAETPAFDRRARMTVYADAYFWRLHGVLVDHFGLVAWLLGPTRFRNLAVDYVLQRPSEDPDIRRFGARLPGFIADHTEESRMPGLAEIAAIEWAMVRALDVPHPALLAPADLAALSPDAWPQMHLHAVPSAFVGPCHHAFTALWDAHLTTAAPDPTAMPVRHVLVWRQGHDVLHRIVDPQEATALARVCTGTPFAVLCEDVDPERVVAWLSRWLGDGLLVAF